MWSGNAGGEDDAAQLLSNEQALACNNAGMVLEHSTPLAQQNANVGPPHPASTHHQVYMMPALLCHPALQDTATSTSAHSAIVQ